MAEGTTGEVTACPGHSVDLVPVSGPWLYIQGLVATLVGASTALGAICSPSLLQPAALDALPPGKPHRHLKSLVKKRERRQKKDHMKGNMLLLLVIFLS